MDDKNSTVLVVRIPYRPDECWTENSKIFADHLSSEIATMQYVKVHMSIPVPSYHSVGVDNGGGGVEPTNSNLWEKVSRHAHVSL